MASEEGTDKEALPEEVTEPELYQCSLCNMTFHDIDDHFTSFHSDNPNGEELVEHEEVALEDDLQVEIETGTEALAFIVKNKDGKFECETCCKTYKSIANFLNHVKTHGDIAKDSIKKLDSVIKQLKSKDDDNYDVVSVANSLKFRCKVCKTIFPTQKQMRLHYSIHKNEELAKDKAPHNVEESFVCSQCNKSLKTANELEMHITAHSETSHGPLQRPEPKKTKSTGDSKTTHACQYCKKEFKRPYEKVKHERVHTGEKPYACDICGKNFRQTYCLSLHKKSVHSDERPYICSFEGCNKRFKSQSVYNHHLNTHSDDKNFKCPHCPKAFKTSVQLAGHKKTHTKPFACQVCTRSFSSLYSVKMHLEVHKNDSIDLKFTCKICSAQYGRLFALSDHMKTAHPEDEVETAEHYIIEESQEVDEQEQVYVVTMA